MIEVVETEKLFCLYLPGLIELHYHLHPCGHISKGSSNIQPCPYKDHDYDKRGSN